MIFDVAAKRASLTPDRDALFWRGRWLTYRELNERAERLAARLHDRGIGKGERVSILAWNHVAHIDLILATAKLGFVYTPFNYRLSVREQVSIAEYVRPSILFYDDANAEAAGAIEASGVPALPLERYQEWLHAQPPRRREPTSDTRSTAEEPSMLHRAASELRATGGERSAPPSPDLHPDDIQMILFTGGTTGLPKGAMQPYRQGIFNAVNTVMSWGLRDDDCVIQATPCFHAAVNAFTVPLLHHGARVVLMDRFSPGEYLDLVEQAGASILFMVPTMYKMLAEHERFATADLSRVRWAISGGAPCPDPVRRAFAAREVRFKQGYGLTEAGVNCFAIELDDADVRPDSVGKPVLHARACIRRADGTPADAGEVGELTLAGPHVFAGYFENPDATDEVLRDGWLWTGDLAQVDDDGFYTIVGRRKEMFISGGENVYPVEIENALYDHPAVAECAVLGVPSERWGEVGLAAIVPRPDAAGAQPAADALRAHLKERLASYKVPKHIAFVEELPKSGAGKILKTELARAFEHGSLTARDGGRRSDGAEQSDGGGRSDGAERSDDRAGIPPDDRSTGHA